MSVVICEFFLKNGYCTLGNNCSLYHAHTQHDIAVYNKTVNGIKVNGKYNNSKQDPDIKEEEEEEYANVTEICFSFDTTGSMSAIINQVRQEIKGIIKNLFSKISNIRIALIAHGDYIDGNYASSYIIKHCNFTRDQNKLINFINKDAYKTRGGGDGGECYEYVLWTAANKLKWTPNARSKALVIIGDDQPHTPSFIGNTMHLDWKNEIKVLQKQRITCFGIYCRYGNEEYSRFYRQIAKRTNGKYLELSNIKNITKLFVALCLKTSNDEDLFKKYKNEILRSSAGNDELSRAIMSLSGMQKDAKCNKIKIDSAIKRLMYDLKEIKREKLIDIAVVPEENNVFIWHVNIKPLQGIFTSVYIHLTLQFPSDYPSNPPKIKLITKIPDKMHSNIENNTVCLPLFGAISSRSKYGSSWSAAYSIISLLVNISSIFSEIDNNSRSKKKLNAKNVLNDIRNTHCNECGHSHNTPYPVLGANKLPFEINEIIINEQHYRVAMKEAIKNKSKQKQQQIIKQERRDRRRGVLIAGNIIETMKNGKFWKIKSAQSINRKYHQTVCWQFTIDMFERNKTSKLYSDYMFGFVDNNNVFFGVGVDGNVVFNNNANYKQLYNNNKTIKQHSIISYILHLNDNNNSDDQLYIFVNYNLISSIVLPTLYIKCESFYPLMYVKDIRLHLTLDIDPKLNNIIHTNDNTNNKFPFSNVDFFNKLQSSYMINTVDRIKDQESWNKLLEKALSGDILLDIFGYLRYSDLIHCGEVNTYWYLILSGHNVLDRCEMRCFYTHESIDKKPNKCILGVGLNVIRSSNKWISSVETEMDLLSLSAYKDYYIDKGAWGETITHFLPLIINEKHSKKARKCLEKRLAKICDEKVFNYKDGLMVITAIMNQFVVQLMANTIGLDNDKKNQGIIDPKHASEKALIGYCAFHHILLYLCQQYPEMRQYATKSIRDFIRDPLKREKSETKDLGKFILHLAIAKNYEWNDISNVFINECLDRQVKWYLQKYPKLANFDQAKCSNKQRIAYTLKSTMISRRLVSFQVFFLQNICKQDGYSLTDLLNNYNKRWGRPTNQQKNLLIQEINKLLNKRENENSWLEYFHSMGIKKFQTNEQVCNALKKAVINSKNKQYHRVHEGKIRQNNRTRARNKTNNKNRAVDVAVTVARPRSVHHFAVKEANKINIQDGEIIEMQGVLEGHNDWITCIKVDINDANRIVSGSRDKSIIVWQIKQTRTMSSNITEGKMKRRLAGHNHFISDIDISLDGNYVLSACWDGLLRLWNIKNGETVRKFIGHKKDVLAVGFSSDNRRIISGGMDKKAVLWNTVGEIKQDIDRAHNSWITCIEFSPNVDEDIFVSASQDKKVKVWQYDNGSSTYIIKYELNGHKACITSMSISPDGSLCATGDKYGIICLWDIENGKLLSTLSASSGTGGLQINCIVFSPNRYWLCFSVGNCIEIIDLETKNNVGILRLAKDEMDLIETSKHYSTLNLCNCIAWSYDGKTLYSGHSDNKIRVWKLISNASL